MIICEDRTYKSAGTAIISARDVTILIFAEGRAALEALSVLIDSGQVIMHYH